MSIFLFPLSSPIARSHYHQVTGLIEHTHTYLLRTPYLGRELLSVPSPVSSIQLPRVTHPSTQYDMRRDPPPPGSAESWLYGTRHIQTRTLSHLEQLGRGREKGVGGDEGGEVI